MKKLRDLLDKISFGHFGIPISLKMVSANSLSCGVQLKLQVLDRDSGLPTQVVSIRSFNGPEIEFMSERILLDEIHHWICTAILHEFNEHFTVSGIRVFDPHPQESK